MRPKGLLGESCGTESGVLNLRWVKGVEKEVDDILGRIGEDWNRARFLNGDAGSGKAGVSMLARLGRFNIGKILYVQYCP